MKHLTFDDLDELENPRRKSSVVIKEKHYDNIAHMSNQSVQHSQSRLYIEYVGNEESAVDEEVSNENADVNLHNEK